MVVQVNAQMIGAVWQGIKSEIRHTPMFKANHWMEMPRPDCDVFLKLEQLQVTGSFKIRGVSAKIQSADQAILDNGIYAASGGNHGRAVAYAGWKRGLKTTVYLPTTTPQDKIDAISRWGANTVVAGQDLDEANVLAAKEATTQNALFIHPYADLNVIIGQGSLGVEIYEQLPQVDTVIMAIGGGGLISGVGTYLKEVNPRIRIIGVEPEFCPTMYNCFEAGMIVPVDEIKTQVGTLAIRKTSPINYELAEACVDQIVLVSDDDMLKASQRLWREFGIAGELSGVASFAGLMSGQIHVDPGEKVCCLICGVGANGIL